LPLTALIPASYIADVELRLVTYRRIAACGTLAEVELMIAELTDRFGPVPEEVEHLLALIRVRIRCLALGIDSVIEREREIVLRPVQTSRLRQSVLSTRLGSASRFTPNSVRLRLPDLEIPWEEALELTIQEVERTYTS
jgi:transcription-repair coupling factor (superfamily II helicase)